MPGLKLLRRKTCTTGDKPLKGARIVGCTHVTAKSAVSPVYSHVCVRVHMLVSVFVFVHVYKHTHKHIHGVACMSE